MRANEWRDHSLCSFQCGKMTLKCDSEQTVRQSEFKVVFIALDRWWILKCHAQSRRESVPQAIDMRISHFFLLCFVVTKKRMQSR